MMENPKKNPTSLAGKRIRMRPVTMEDTAIFSQIAPVDTFRYYVTAMPKAQSPEGFQEYVQLLVESPSVLGYVIESVENGCVLGSSCFMDIRPEDEHVEIGMTWYAPEWRGTFVNPESKLVMLTHAFENLGCTKVTLKCDDRNEHSKAAIRKLGAKFEGTLRRHRLNDLGEFRDTTYFGILSEEWDAVKEGLELRLQSL